MRKQLVIDRYDCQGEDWSAVWEGNRCLLSHSFGQAYMATALDEDGNVLCSATSLKPDEISFVFEIMPSGSVTVLLMGTDAASVPADRPFYSGTEEDVMMFCKSLDISEDRLASVSSLSVSKYQDVVDRAIDGYLIPYYFLPLTPYSNIMPDGSVERVFPGKIRMIALQWTAGLMLQSEFQNMEPNVHEAGVRFVEDAKKEMQQMVDFSTIIPGQRRKNPSPTMPPNLAPSKTSEILI